jgi:hypothetical protein
VTRPAASPGRREEEPEIPIPREAVPYVRALGVERAVKLFEIFGGASLYIAANPSPRSSAAKVIGADGVRALYAALSGRETGTQNVRIPLAKRWVARQLVRGGMPVSKVARRLHVADKTVRAWVPLAERGGSAQLELF